MEHKNLRNILYGLVVVLIVSLSLCYQGQYPYVMAHDLLEDDEDYGFEAAEPIIDVANCSVSYSGEINDFVEWKIKPLDGYEDVRMEMSLRAPNGNIVNTYYDSSFGGYFKIDENGYYIFRYYVDEWGAGDGVYQIHRFFVLTDDNQYTITNGYKGIDFSGLSFNVSGQKKDTTAPVIEKDNIAICKEELSYTTGEKYQEIQFQIPVEENESGIQSIEIWYGPYASFGEGFSSAWDFSSGIGLSGGVTLNPLGVIVVGKSLEEWQRGVIYGIDYVEVIDFAGNTSIVNLATDWCELDAVPERYRFTIDDIHVHTYSEEWTIDVLPTCSEEGVQSRHCTTIGCIGACDFEDISATYEHTYGEWKVTKEATSSEKGLKERNCSMCGVKETEEIPALGGDTNTTPDTDESDNTNTVPGVDVNDNTDKNSSDVTNDKSEENKTATPENKNTMLTDVVNKCKVVVTSSNVKNPTVAYKKPTNIKEKTIKIPDQVMIEGVSYKVTSISDNAFANNKKVTKIVIGKNVTSIGKSAFKKCTNLKTVEIKSTKLDKIGANAFYGAKKLTKITLKSTKLTKKSIGKNALKGTNEKLVIKVPKSKVKKYKTYLKNKGNKTVTVKK
ncbi:MAG: leucine-rich repeat protein [Lachnospiraceae bacterium]|nr:leucine-rich repeat protein [Lachnospiraceae bacterium]